ncbi:MAG: nitrite reductase [Gammaproteobacteria bacterium]|nr:nitrite reductase [Gammaproteobacteria bacterium]MCP4088264.1 nitrite reductase [Gammaproteobacteria bacterium]MCP4276425.1 nitrite reductase [Gammaproteobacteria bacterium]MCP4831072.1 nitrite reductase [Gammaproteobacteria bacterium]MCP4929340.1 nitrite reductase [Gammaproteobacteria bacterium]
MNIRSAVSATIASGLLLTFGGAAGAADLQPVPKISEDELKTAQYIYFDRCSGCHGALRKGATGKNIEPANTRKKTLAALEKILYEGTDGGMPGWGKDGFMTPEETNLMARFVQNDVPEPPEWNMKEMKESWKVYVPVSDRPAKPPKGVNWENYFGVVLRDAGKIAIIDGDTKETVNIINSGFATHILRTSATGRYMYAIGRDGKATMMDMWATPPDIVAEVRTGIDARSIDTSKFKGFEDKYAVVGDYWPPHYVILEGDTLKPLKIIGTRGYTYDTNEYRDETRVASIVASHHAPEWILTLKETGVVLLVDYSKMDEDTVVETKINAERFLHDGGWDSTKRYFMVAANARDTISVIDTVDRKLVANIITGTKPHPGRGANWVDPEYGRVWATVHLGEGLVSIISTDPKKDYAWTVVREWELGGNSLFIKTHPKSTNVYCDNTINQEKSNVLTVFDIENPEAAPRELTFDKKVVHMEFNKDGNEVWISLWDKEGEVVILDDKTLEVKGRVKGLYTPTGKFNVYNTTHDIY